jgi:hypothetical protein
MCIKLDLIEGNVLFTDGSKFRANASINNTWTQKRCEQYIKKIEEQIDKVITDSEKTDCEEEKEQSLIKIKEQIHDKTKLVNKIKDVLTTLKEQEKESINSTDKDSVNAVGRQGTHACFNVQSTVDNKHGLIVHAEAVSQSNDYNQLSEQVQKSAEILGKKPKHVCADCGYADIEDIKKIDPEINVIVPSRKQAQEEKGLCPIKPFDKKYFSYNKACDEYTCPEGKSLKFVGYDGRDNTKLRYQANGHICQRCQNFGDPDNGKCTKSINGRRIMRLADEDVKEQMEAKYNLPESQKLYKLRSQKVEHPFGHIKYNLSAGQFMLRGKQKVNAEVSILATCFNMARMITILGISNLLLKLKMS